MERTGGKEPEKWFVTHRERSGERAPSLSWISSDYCLIFHTGAYYSSAQRVEKVIHSQCWSRGLGGFCLSTFMTPWVLRESSFVTPRGCKPIASRQLIWLKIKTVMLLAGCSLSPGAYTFLWKHLCSGEKALWTENKGQFSSCSQCVSIAGYHSQSGISSQNCPPVNEKVNYSTVMS